MIVWSPAADLAEKYPLAPIALIAGQPIWSDCQQTDHSELDGNSIVAMRFFRANFKVTLCLPSAAVGRGSDEY